MVHVLERKVTGSWWTNAQWFYKILGMIMYRSDGSINDHYDMAAGCTVLPRVVLLVS